MTRNEWLGMKDHNTAKTFVHFRVVIKPGGTVEAPVWGPVFSTYHFWALYGVRNCGVPC